MEEEVMTVEQFEKLFELDPEANKNQLYTYLLRHFNSGMTSFDGKRLDYNFVYKQYKSYCDYCLRKNANKDPKFISKVDKKQGIMYFIANGMCDSQWSLSKSPRDFYMLGNMSFADFTKLSDRFNALLTARDPSRVEQERLTFKNVNYEPKSEINPKDQTTSF